MRTIGYAESSCKSGRARRFVYGNVRVQAEIARLDTATRAEHIADRATRQRFWTKTMQGDGRDRVTMADRLRASELLGRSEADFTDNIQDSRAETPDPLSVAETAALRAMAKILTSQSSLPLLEIDKETG